MMNRRTFLGGLMGTLAARVESASASNDGDLRRMVRAAGLVPYWSFKAVKDFSYPEVNTTQSVSIREFTGKVVAVNLWATWCPPCVEEMPSRQTLHEQFHARGVTVVGINISDRTDLAGIRNWLLKRNLSFLNLISESAARSSCKLGAAVFIERSVSPCHFGASRRHDLE
jgi:thiol-disulfide isomerase/thioredoxin